MAKRVAVTNLNASTIDILNVIRENATYEYQNTVPTVTQETDIPKVGERLYGHPALASQFINALVNRIAAVKIKSAVFNNPYEALKKGYLEFGETVEEVYVRISKARIFSAEKAAGREFKRTLPKVRAAFHTINWRAQYPITIQNEDLRMAFTSFDGVESLISKIIDSVYTGANYDEYLLFKYLIIKAVAHGKMFPISIDTSVDGEKAAAVAFRGTSNKLPFMSKLYNIAGVETTTPKENQHIFMDAQYNAQFDVNVLASAFNMDKADFMGKLHLIDSFTEFDNERFNEIRAESDGLEEVTAAELALMADVKAILVDDEWFQVYDNLTVMTEQYVANGLYWNYFYTVWKTISSSPFANAVVFIDGTAPTVPATLTATVVDKLVSPEATIITLNIAEANSLHNSGYRFEQSDAGNDLIAVQKYGVYIFSKEAVTAEATAPVIVTNGATTWTGATELADTADVGDTITLSNE